MFTPLCSFTSRSTLTSRPFNVPTLVKEELTTVLANVVDDNISVPPILYDLPDTTSMFSLDVHDPVEPLHASVLSPSVPASIVIPPPSAVLLDGFVVTPKRIFTSDTSTSLLLIVVVVPSTTIFPVTRISPPI